jgi:hypothetical protein
MKRKALVVALLCVMGLAAICSGNAEAATAYNCVIVAVGNNGGYNYAYLTDAGGTFTDQVFLIDNASGFAKEMLAILLTAWANSQNVGVLVSGITPQSTIFAVNTIK